MPRILIDLSDVQVDALGKRAETERRPRAAVIRDAVDAYLAHYQSVAATDVFGLWDGRSVDGLAYQEARRSEW